LNFIKSKNYIVHYKRLGLMLVTGTTMNLSYKEFESTASQMQECSVGNIQALFHIAKV